MNLWQRMKRLNDQYDDWTMRAAERVIAKLDRGAMIGTRPGKSHIGVWDLLDKKQDHPARPE